ncbi:MAG TPA: histidine--tRNA ligase [Patescibacteria group bacterium]|nr:histidine--tRNA ligase [Patescibacteria group bacterium]
MNKIINLKGFRDFLPEEKRVRDYIAAKIKDTFEIFGFEPLETPTLEYANLLLGKYGKEADKLVYTFDDRGGRKLGLRYDQTVPTARVLSQYQDLPKYFRRYQIQNVFRADKPQKGRYREFTQCDPDIFGSTSPIADAEIIAVTYFAFKNVGFKNIILKINDRKILFSILDKYKTDKIDILSIIQTIDKLDKKSENDVKNELIDKGLTSKESENALNDIKNAQKTENLEEIIRLSVNLGVPENAIEFSPFLARGLDYYTGMIFEVIIPEYSIGSFGGGGRYDKLIGQLSGTDIPAVGIAFGFDRMVEAAKELRLVPTANLGTKVLVTVFDANYLSNSIEITKTLRLKNISTELFPSIEKLDKQLKYADKKQIPYVIIVGQDEVKNNTVTLKNMKTKEQKTLTIDNVCKLLLA